MNWQERIVINHEIMIGKPVIRGTRITVENIVNELASGYTIQEILAAHPRLTQDDILAALQYAAAIIKNEKVYLISA